MSITGTRECNGDVMLLVGVLMYWYYCSSFISKVPTVRTSQFMVIIIIVAAVIKNITATSAQNTLEISISNNHTYTPFFFFNFLVEFFNSSSRKSTVCNRQFAHAYICYIFIHYFCVHCYFWQICNIWHTYAFVRVKSTIIVQHNYWLTVI